MLQLQQLLFMKKKQKKQERLLVGIILTVVYILYVLGYIHYKEILIAYPKLSMTEAMNRAVNELFTSPLMIFPLPGNIWGGLGISTLLMALFGIMFLADIGLRKHDNPDKVGGDAKFLENLDEYNKKFTEPFGQTDNSDSNNMILSELVRMSMQASRIRRNLNVFCVGGSGAGKSYNIVGPNGMQANCSYVFTDPSGGLLDEYGSFFENFGYRVKVLNLNKMHKGNHYNPFRYIHSDKDIEILVNTLITNTTPPESHGEAFWEKCETALLVACIAYLYHYSPKKNQNFSTVMKLLRAADIDENDSSTESPLDHIFREVEERDPDSFAVKQYKTFKMGAGKTLKGILISVAVRLQQFDLQEVMDLTDTDDIDLTSFIHHKTALFLVLPTGDKTFNFIASMLESQLFDIMYRYCEDTAKYTYVLSEEAKGTSKKSFNPIKRIFKIKTKSDKRRAITHRVFTADSIEEMAKAKEAGEQFLKDIKGGYVEYDEKTKLYYIKDKNGVAVDYRGQKEWAERELHTLQHCTLHKGSEILPSNHGMCMPWHVRFMMDEFANVGKIPSFPEKVSTIRKYEISTTIIVQSITQLKNMYKDDWSNIIGNCDSTIYLGGGADLDTFEWLSKLLGKKTITVMNTSLADNKGGSSSFNKQGIELLSISELRTLPEDECVCVLKSLDPFVGEKYRSDKHPNRVYVHPGFEFDKEKAETIDNMDNPDREKPTVTVIEETEKEKEQREKQNEQGKQAAMEFKNNVDALGEKIIEDPKEIDSLAKKLNLNTQTGINEAMESVADINDFGPDEMLFSSTQA